MSLLSDLQCGYERMILSNTTGCRNPDLNPDKGMGSTGINKRGSRLGSVAS